jgi:hypothetical protein
MSLTPGAGEESFSGEGVHLMVDPESKEVAWNKVRNALLLDASDELENQL